MCIRDRGIGGSTFDGLFIRCGDVAFDEAANGEITIVDRTSNAACNILYITGQKPFATATGGNRNSGSVSLYTWAPVAGGTAGTIDFTVADVLIARMLDDRFALGPDSATGLPLAFGNTASHTGLLRFPRGPETTVVADRLRIIALRNYADTDDLTMMTAWKDPVNGDSYEVGDDEFDAY